MKYLHNIDLSKNELQNAVIQPLATAPASPKAGQIYYNTTDKMTYQWDGTEWKAIGISTADQTKISHLPYNAAIDLSEGILLLGLERADGSAVINSEASISVASPLFFTDLSSPTVPGDGVKLSINIDAAMSASSANPVQNKVVKTYIDNAIANIPAEQFLDLTKTTFVQSFAWSSTTYPGSTNPNLNGKPVLVLALKDEDGNIAYSFLSLEDLIDVYKGTSPITVSGNTISHANSGVTAGSKGPTANVAPAFGGTFTVPQVTVNATGHITVANVRTITIPDDAVDSVNNGLMRPTHRTALMNMSGGYIVKRITNNLAAGSTSGYVSMDNANCEPISLSAYPSDSLEPVMIDWYPDGDGDVCYSIASAYSSDIFIEVFYVDLDKKVIATT